VAASNDRGIRFGVRGLLLWMLLVGVGPTVKSAPRLCGVLTFAVWLDPPLLLMVPSMMAASILKQQIKDPYAQACRVLRAKYGASPPRQMGGTHSAGVPPPLVRREHRREPRNRLQYCGHPPAMKLGRRANTTSLSSNPGSSSWSFRAAARSIIWHPGRRWEAVQPVSELKEIVFGSATEKEGTTWP